MPSDICIKCILICKDSQKKYTIHSVLQTKPGYVAMEAKKGRNNLNFITTEYLE